VPRLSEEAKTERRQRVLDGARRCFARYGYEGATVVRLEEEIGLSRGAIFNWFPSKQELFIALAARDNERLLLLFAEEGLEAILDALLRDDPDWLAVYIEFGRRLRADAELRERWKTIVPESARERSRAWIEEGQRAKRLRSDFPAEEIRQFLGVILDGIVVQRALGFDAPEPALLHRLTRDAIGASAALDDEQLPDRRRTP
jgi:TetR/AcrR family transcriptional regulator, transcriptional repressor of aconitase